MPTTVFNSLSGDSTVVRNAADAVWATTVNAAAGTSVSAPSTQNSNFGARTIDAGATFQCFRGFVAFDITPIGAGSTITSVTLSLYRTADAFSNADTTAAHIVSATQLSTSQLVVGDYSLIGSVSFANIALASITQDQYNVWTFNASGIASVQAALSGQYFKCACRNSLDLNTTTPTGDNLVSTAWSESANPPQLTVIYTQASTAVVKPFPIAKALVNLLP